MAKRRAKKEETSIGVSQAAIDEVFGSAIDQMQVKLQKKGVLVGHNPVITVLPVPAFIIRYLLQNEGLPLSCIYQVVGQQASYKSTFAAEMLRWHRICGGVGLLLEAETKATPDLRNSVLNWEPGACRVEDCEKMEDWQTKTLWSTRSVQKQLLVAGGLGRTVPYCIIVDSLTGKASAKTAKNIMDEGYAGMHYPVEAKSIADFMRAYPQELLGWPFTFVGVNHMKPAKDENGQLNLNIPGGWALKFQCSAIFEMERVGGIKDFASYKAATIRLGTIKNSYGPDGMRVKVRFKTWYQEDAPEVMRLHSRFEWWEAGINFLATGDGLSAARAKTLVPQMKEVCDIREKAGGSQGKLYYSNRLGVSASDAMQPHDLGVLLETKPDVLADLYQLLGVQRRPLLRPGVDFLVQQEENRQQYAENEARMANNVMAQVAAAEEVAWPSGDSELEDE